MLRTTTGYSEGHFYTVFEEEIEFLADKLGMTNEGYMRVQDELIRLFSMGCTGKGADKLDIDEWVKKIIKIVLEGKKDD